MDIRKFVRISIGIMKTLHRYIILSFIGPFLMTFFIAVFILLIRWLYVYVDDLIGKGLTVGMLAELFFYVALNTFPLALPLAILLSSLMTFGNLGEHFELVALKSSGLSLQKIMLPLIIVSLLTSAGAFLFSNNVLPHVNLKMQTLIYDIQQKKPALNIKEGIFYNGIDGYTIRLEKKDPDGIRCEGVLIYDHTDNIGNNKVIYAKSGRMMITKDKQYMIIDLYDGTSYEEVADRNKEYNDPLTRSHFKEQTIRFDLSGFKMIRSDEELFKSNYAMLDISQIHDMIDSNNFDKEARINTFRETYLDMMSENKVFKKNQKPEPTTAAQAEKSVPAGEIKNPFGINLPSSDTIQRRVLNPKDPYMKNKIVDHALTLVRAKKYLIEGLIGEMDNYDRPINSLNIEWHKKFTLSIACLILFFVGAPLGAIIRKGGLGMPVVVSVIIFILFWVITISGEKTAREGVIAPYIGMWIASAVTLPLGIFLTIKATSDSSLFDIDKYLKPFRRIGSLFRSRS